MIVETHIHIDGSAAAIWAAITDIEHAADLIGGIERIEIVHRPPDGIEGLRWRETRMLFGELATVEKWITEAVENESYTTRAEDGGFVFLTTFRIAGSGEGAVLASSHETRPQGIVARLKSLPMVFFRGVIRKAIERDLRDLKTAVEGAEAGSD